MTEELRDSKRLRYPGLQERIELVHDALPKDGSFVSSADICAELLCNPVYNSNGDAKKIVHPRVITHLSILRGQGKAERYGVKPRIRWSREGGDPPPSLKSVAASYSSSSWERKALEALRVTPRPSSFEQIVNRLFGKGSVINPFDSELTREECEDGVHAGIFQLLEDEVITENEHNGDKDGTYKLV